MKQRLLSLAIILALLSSCSAGEQPTDADSGVTADSPISLTDQTGREVTLDTPAEKIVSCYYVSSYALLALDLADNIVGIENKADTRALYSYSAPEVVSLPAVGTMKEANLEQIAALDPDLVIMPKKLSESAKTLSDLGFNVILVSPENHEQLCDMISLLGEACGATERADMLISYYDTQMTALSAMTADTDSPTVYMCGNSSYLTTAPADMYQSSLIDLAGGVNVADDLDGDYWTEISYETLLTYDPDVIVIPSGADYTADDIAGDSQLSSLTAVQNGAIYEMPSDLDEWDSPIPSGILGAMWLTSVLHPDKYTEDSFIEDATSFYETFYGFTPDPALLK